ncbi:hypothetical protein AOQ84DRAFT_94380 [Glonium stellatum]|uniref:Transmembrane protein n=1 Tax=Glonium stellatum TaxID=574774 RepID=A0A8E2EVH5_9PEZI|nr:hypothetical protein AOQ84DRAFT_94380 [Glonium stellatum]
MNKPPEMLSSPVRVHRDRFQVSSRHYHSKWHRPRSMRECSWYQITVTITGFFFLALSINIVSFSFRFPATHPIIHKHSTAASTPKTQRFAKQQSMLKSGKSFPSKEVIKVQEGRCRSA